MWFWSETDSTEVVVEIFFVKVLISLKEKRINFLSSIIFSHHELINPKFYIRIGSRHILLWHFIRFCQSWNFSFKEGNFRHCGWYIPREISCCNIRIKTVKSNFFRSWRNIIIIIFPHRMHSYVLFEIVFCFRNWWLLVKISIAMVIVWTLF